MQKTKDTKKGQKVARQSLLRWGNHYIWFADQTSQKSFKFTKKTLHRTT